MQLSAITVLERVRGYARLGRRSERAAYLSTLGRVWPVDTGVALATAEVLALVPEAPSPGKRTHRMVESRAGRMSRWWRFDVMIACTALVTGDLELGRDVVIESFAGGECLRPTATSLMAFFLLQEYRALYIGCQISLLI